MKSKNNFKKFINSRRTSLYSYSRRQIDIFGCFFCVHILEEHWKGFNITRRDSCLQHLYRATPIQRYLGFDIDCVLLSFLLIHLSFTVTPIKIKLFHISYYSSIQFAYFCSLHSFVQLFVLPIVSHNFVPFKWNLSVRKPKMPSFLEVIFESRKTNNK